MQCISPKSTGFNEFSSNIATAIVCLATNRVYNFSKMIFDGQFGVIKHTETYPVPFHTQKVFTTLRVNSPSFSDPPQQETSIPSQSHTDIPTPRRLTKGTIWIAQSKVPSTGADEPASPLRDDNHEEAFPTATSLDAG
ncbi:hypothetical protein Tco_1117825 [Tanacetum coccineum]